MILKNLGGKGGPGPQGPLDPPVVSTGVVDPVIMFGVSSSEGSDPADRMSSRGDRRKLQPRQKTMCFSEKSTFFEVFEIFFNQV